MSKHTLDSLKAAFGGDSREGGTRENFTNNYYPFWNMKTGQNYRDWETDRKSTGLNSSHRSLSRMPSSA